VSIERRNKERCSIVIWWEYEYKITVVRVCGLWDNQQVVFIQEIKDLLPTAVRKTRIPCWQIFGTVPTSIHKA